MNKIKVSNNKIEDNCNLDIVDNVVTIDNLSDIHILYEKSDISLKFIIKSPCKIFEYINNSHLDNTYVLESDLVFNRFSNNSSLKTVLDIVRENVSVNYFYSTINKDDNDYSIDIKHNAKNTNALIKNHGINVLSNKLDFLINSYIPLIADNAISNQDSSIILLNDNNCKIKPNLIVFNDDISASHASFIGHFNPDKMFYLMSRGLNYNESEKLLVKAFLLGDMDIDFSFKEMILNDINSYWR